MISGFLSGFSVFEQLSAVGDDQFEEQTAVVSDLVLEDHAEVPHNDAVLVVQVFLRHAVVLQVVADRVEVVQDVGEPVRTTQVLQFLQLELKAVQGALKAQKFA